MKSMVPEWFDGWRDKYSTLLVDGLTDGPTYVRLFRKECPMLDVQLALRPFVNRLTEDKIAFCGKLSVFPVKGSVKAEPANEKVMAGWLAGAFPNIDFPKQNGQRVGTIILTLATAPLDAGKAFREHWAESNMVDSLLGWIEQTHGIEVPDRKLVARALKEAYTHWLDVVFYDGSDAAPSTPLEVGTEVAHGDNILPFVKKSLTGEAESESPGE